MVHSTKLGKDSQMPTTPALIGLRLSLQLRWIIKTSALVALCALPPLTAGAEDTVKFAPPAKSAEPETSVAPYANDSLPAPLGEHSSGLTLQSLEEQALSCNPSVRRLGALVDAARANTLQVGLKPNPEIGYEGQQLGSGGQAEQHGVLFSQEVVTGGKLGLNRAVADRERQRLEQQYMAQRQRVLTDVRMAYYEVLLAQRQIEIAEGLIRIGSEGSQAVESLFQAKEVGRGDVLQAQLETENARILAENAHNRYNSAWQNLAAVVGEPTMSPQSLIGDPMIPARDFKFDDALRNLLSMSPEVAAAQLEVERARAAVQRARVEPVPNVNFEGLVNVVDNGIGGKPDGGVRVAMPLPIFNRNQGGIAKAEHELIASSQALNQLELGLQARFAPVFEQYANARAQVERYQKTILPAADESLALNRKRYSAGEGNYTTFLTAQRTYSQTQLNYLSAIRALRIAEVQIEGMLLSNSLDASPAVPVSLQVGTPQVNAP